MNINEFPRIVLRVSVSGDSDLRSSARVREPVTTGVPWPRGVLTESTGLVLEDSGGSSIPLQRRVLDRWPDGSTRWLLVDFQADCSGEETYVLGISQTGDRGLPNESIVDDSVLCVRKVSKEQVEVDTGRGVFDLATGGNLPFGSVQVDGREVVDSAASSLQVEGEDGRIFSGRFQQLHVLEEGPLRTCVEGRGQLVGDGADPLADLIGRYHFFAGSSTVRIELTLRNPRAAEHPGGIWCLGDPGSILFRDASLALSLPVKGEVASVVGSVEMGAPFIPLETPIELYQDSSGGECWRSPNHLNRLGKSPVSFRGYTFEAGNGRSTGLRATPVLLLRHSGGSLGFAMRRFWENFPKALETDGRSLTIRLFPKQYGDLHELQGGEQKTHSFCLAFGEDQVTETALDWCRNPLSITLSCDWVADSGVIPWLSPRATDPSPAYLALVDQAIEGQSNFVVKREKIDEYGWRNFGDIYADHESAHHSGETPFVSHYNNQYDAILGFGIHFLRSADPRWVELMEDLAGHVVDIDIYHTDFDRAAYNHGLFWHTCHYIDAGQSSHRSYPRHSQVSGGGPSPSHLYTGGLLLHYFLTGSHASRGAVLELSGYVLAADDGRRSRFRLLDTGETGIISESLPGYHGPGRAPGNSLNALLDGFRLTSDRRFMKKAEQLIRRCIHPADDLAERKLDEPEYRWFYTVFLQSLGKYLEAKIELGEFDSSYAYGRASLLHYARWAAAHERPWLDRPELLEFPTETWAAQDMRKSEVFRLAIRHADEYERAIFKERAEFFFRHSVEQLSGMPTRGRSRPVVLMLVHGYGQARLDECCESPAPVPRDPVIDFGEPISFRSQRERIVRKLALVLALGSLLAILGLALMQ